MSRLLEDQAIVATILVLFLQEEVHPANDLIMLNIYIQSFSMYFYLNTTQLLFVTGANPGKGHWGVRPPPTLPRYKEKKEKKTGYKGKVQGRRENERGKGEGEVEKKRRKHETYTNK